MFSGLLAHLHTLIPDFGFKLAIVVLAILVTLFAQMLLLRVLRRAVSVSGLPQASIFVNILRTLLWFFALLAILRPVFGVDATWLVTTLGVVSVALSFGLQDTVSNVVSGLVLMLGGIIHPGDYIEVAGNRGRVIDVTWRSTTLDTENGNRVIIPNAILNKTSLTRLSSETVNVLVLSITMKAGDCLEQRLDRLRNELIKLLGQRLHPAKNLQLRAHDIQDSSLEIELTAALLPGVSLKDTRELVIMYLYKAHWL